MAKRREPSPGCETDMTPMIDVVFQLIIFFIVTITLTKKFNENIRLADGPHGTVIDSRQSPRTLTIEIDARGRLSLHGAPVSYTRMRDLIRSRYNRMGPYPVLIRADKFTRHEYVRTVMNLCTEAGLARVGFVAVQKNVAQG